MRFGGILALAGFCSLTSFASTIFEAFSTPGDLFTVTLGDSVHTGEEMAGSEVIVIFESGSATCTWTAAGICTSPGQFSVEVTPPTSNSHSADWVITNLRVNAAGNNLVSITVNGVLGATAFNPDTDENGPVIDGSCGQTATTGFGNCRGPESTSQGTTEAQGSITLSNALHLANQTPNMDLFGIFTLTFTNGFSGGESFQFKLDTDGLSSATLDDDGGGGGGTIPEPGTFLFSAAGLGLLAALKFRRRIS